jgi:hypothetical protein
MLHTEIKKDAQRRRKTVDKLVHANTAYNDDCDQ